MFELTPGWACDGNGCFESVNDRIGEETKLTLEKAGWLVESLHGVVIRAWCPKCRKGKLARLRQAIKGNINDVQI